MVMGSIDKASYFGIDISSLLFLCVILPKVRTSLRAHDDHILVRILTFT